MTLQSRLPVWTWIAPAAGVLVLAAAIISGAGTVVSVLATITLIATVFAAVFHAELVAHRVGEPFGTLVLAVAVTVIEVALIVSAMLAAPEAKVGVARDTVFAAVIPMSGCILN